MILELKDNSNKALLIGDDFASVSSKQRAGKPHKQRTFRLIICFVAKIAMSKNELFRAVEK